MLVESDTVMVESDTVMVEESVVMDVASFDQEDHHRTGNHRSRAPADYGGLVTEPSDPEAVTH